MTLVRTFKAALAGVAATPRQLLIDGCWSDAADGGTMPTINPATGLPLAEVACGGAADIDLAVTAARRAFEGPWSATTPYDRQRILLRLADLIEANYDTIALLDSLDMGVPITRARAGRHSAPQLLRYYAGVIPTLRGETISPSVPGAPFVATLREPVGVVGAITPWNAPFRMCVWKAGPALAAGCTIILKPAEQSPLSALYFGQLCLEAGVPPGVVNVVPGMAEAGKRLAEHPGVDKISFTGSTGTGQHIIRASAVNVKRLSLELGGKSAHIILNDADLDLAAPAAAQAVFQNSGQICSAGTRLFVEDAIHDEFVERVLAETAALRMGDPLDPETQLGPLVDQAQKATVQRYISVGLSEGARLLAGGADVQEKALAAGSFVPPTVFAGVRDDMTIAREEIFGPVLSILRFSDRDEVIRRANASEYGLGAGLWTRDVGAAHGLGRRLRAGTVWVNCYQMMDPAVPFGGYRLSGYGRESGYGHVHEFLETKALWIR